MLDNFLLKIKPSDTRFFVFFIDFSTKVLDTIIHAYDPPHTLIADTVIIGPVKGKENNK